MQRQHGSASAHKARRLWPHTAVLLCALAPAFCAAQAVSPAAAASAPGPDGAPSEAARRQALGPFRMILQNATAPVRARPANQAADPRKAPGPAQADSNPASAVPAVTVPGATPAAAAAAVAPSASPAAPAPGTSPPAPLAAELAPAPGAIAAAPAVLQPKPLIPVRQDPPELTGAQLRDPPEGNVKVGFAVRPDGTTAEVRVLSSTNRRLNAAAVAAVAGWRFQPIDETRPVEIDLVFKPAQ